MTHLSNFPHIRIEGAPRDRGLAYGRQAAERIGRGEQIYRNSMQQHGFDWGEVRALARDFAPSIAAIDPAYLEELQAIADGAGVELETVIVINARSELFNGRSPGQVAAARQAMPSEGCTSALAYGSATRDGGMIHGQNWDFNADCVHSCVVLEVIPEEGPRLMTFVEAGGLARSGINDRGISVTANNLECEQDEGRTGVPLSIIRRRILSATTFAGALGAVTSVPRAVSNNMTISCARGNEAISLEVTPQEVFLVHPDARGLFAHANHFQSAEALSKIQDKARFGRTPCTYYRDRRVMRHLESRVGALTIEDFKTAFEDDFGTPYAVCRPPFRSGSGHLVSTVATVIFDALRGEIHARPAPYDPATRFTTYRLAGAAAEAA